MEANNRSEGIHKQSIDVNEGENMSESIEKSYELSYAHSYFRTEIPIAVCPSCGIIDGHFQRESDDGMGGGYGTSNIFS
jgi:hypothetical protein